MYSELAKKEKDKARQAELVDTLLLIHDQRIAHFGKEGLVRARKGTAILNFRPADVDLAVTELERAHELLGDTINTGAIYALFQAKCLQYKSKTITKATLVEDTKSYFGIIDRYLAKPAVEHNAKIKERYLKLEEVMVRTLVRIGDCNDLEMVFRYRRHIRIDDNVFDQQLMNAFDDKNCTKSAMYIEVAEAQAGDGNASPEMIRTLGDFYYNESDYNNARRYYRLALEKTEDMDQKHSLEIRLAKVEMIKKNYEQVRYHARKALAMKSNSGEAYLLIGDAYAASRPQCVDGKCSSRAVYWVAVDMFEKAKRVDPSIKDKADKRIAAAKSMFPAKDDCFFEGLNAGDTYHVKCWINVSTIVRVRE